VKGKVSMNKKNAGAVFILLFTCVLAGQAFAQGSGIKFNSNADDLAKINSVLEEFRQDIVHKDGYALTKLVLNPNVLFHSVNSQEKVDSARKYNARFDGIGPSALDGFAQFLATSKDKLEEKFHNIEIHQDGDLGLVTFNYDFLVNEKVSNFGVEHWILCKIDGQWKILSLVWTSYDAKN
jgi:ketosteroid isomerase-like protein